MLTFFAYNWINNGGIERTMISIASIQVGVCLLSIPMCKWSLVPVYDMACY